MLISLSMSNSAIYYCPFFLSLRLRRLIFTCLVVSGSYIVVATDAIDFVAAVLVSSEALLTLVRARETDLDYLGDFFASEISFFTEGAAM